MEYEFISGDPDGTYRMKVKSVSKERLVHASYIDGFGEEVEMFIPVGHLEGDPMLGKQTCFEAGKEFNMIISDNGRKMEFIEL